MRSSNYNLVKYSIGLATAGSVLLGGRVMADMVSFSGDYGSAGSPISAGGTTTISLNKFDTALGTLNEVILTLTSYDNVIASAVNISAFTQPYGNVVASMQVQVNALGLLTSATGTTTPVSGTIPAHDFVGQTLTTQLVTPPTASATLSSGFAAYEGASGTRFDVTVDPQTVNVSGSVANGSVFLGGDGSSYGHVGVEYLYTPAVSAPEPSALLGGLGAMGTLAMMAWRKRK